MEYRYMKNRLWRKRFGIQKRESFRILQDRNKTDDEQILFALVASASELNNCLMQVESQLLETNVINNSTEIMNISAVPLDMQYEAFLPREEEIQGTSDFSASNETIVFLATEIANKVASFDYFTLATAIVNQLKLPKINSEKYGLLNNEVENKVEENFKKVIAEWDSPKIWTKPFVSRNTYGFSPISELLTKELLTIKETAYLLNTSDDGIRAKIQRHEIDSLKIRGQRKVITTSIMQYIKPTNANEQKVIKAKPEEKRMSLMEKARALNAKRQNAGVQF